MLAAREGEALSVKFEELIVPASFTVPVALISRVPAPAPRVNVSVSALPKSISEPLKVIAVMAVVWPPAPWLKRSFVVSGPAAPERVPKVRSAFEITVAPEPNVNCPKSVVLLKVIVEVPVVITASGASTSLSVVEPANKAEAPDSIISLPFNVTGVAALATGYLVNPAGIVTVSSV